MFETENLRDLLSLAKLLRQFAKDHLLSTDHNLFVGAAVALEARAHFLANRPKNLPMNLKRDVALHAPVNMLV